MHNIHQFLIGISLFRCRFKRAARSFILVVAYSDERTSVDFGAILPMDGFYLKSL